MIISLRLTLFSADCETRALNDFSQPEHEDQLSERVSLATLAMSTATAVINSAVNPNERIYDVWRRALKTDDDAVLTNSVYTFRTQLRQLKAQIERLAFLADDAKAPSLETVAGLDHSTDFITMMAEWSRVADCYGGEKLMRLAVMRDILKHASRASRPTEKGLHELSVKAEAMADALAALDLPEHIRESLQDRFDSFSEALDRAMMLGGDFVSAEAACQARWRDHDHPLRLQGVRCHNARGWIEGVRQDRRGAY